MKPHLHFATASRGHEEALEHGGDTWDRIINGGAAVEDVKCNAIQSGFICVAELADETSLAAGW